VSEVDVSKGSTGQAVRKKQKEEKC